MTLGTIYPGLMVTSAVLYHVAWLVNVTIDIRNVCVFLAPFFSSLTTIITYLLTKELRVRTKNYFANFQHLVWFEAFMVVKYNKTLLGYQLCQVAKSIKPVFWIYILRSVLHSMLIAGYLAWLTGGFTLGQAWYLAILI